MEKGLEMEEKNSFETWIKSDLEPGKRALQLGTKAIVVHMTKYPRGGSEYVGRGAVK